MPTKSDSSVATKFETLNLSNYLKCHGFFLILFIDCIICFSYILIRNLFFQIETQDPGRSKYGQKRRSIPDIQSGSNYVPYTKPSKLLSKKGDFG